MTTKDLRRLAIDGIVPFNWEILLSLESANTPRYPSCIAIS